MNENRPISELMADRFEAKWVKAQRELAALKARRCDGCEYYDCDDSPGWRGPLQGTCEMTTRGPDQNEEGKTPYMDGGDIIGVCVMLPPDFSCKFWAAKEPDRD